MNHGCIDAQPSQGLGNSFRAALGAREYETPTPLLSEQVIKHFLLHICGDLERLQTYILGRLERGPECEAYRTSHVVLHEMCHGSFERRREEHRLPVLR